MRIRSGRPRVEVLEDRLALSGLAPDVTLVSVSTADSKSVIVNYRVENGPITQPFVLEIDRARGPQAASGDTAVAAATIEPGDGTTEGEHQRVIPIVGGLPPDPAAPYVVAVDRANGESVSFRTHVIGVVVHGGIQDSKQTPDWELKLARELKGIGYDQVIAFNWAAQSNTPGEAPRQGPKLASLIRAASTAFPAGDPVDLHVIGHSEGAVVVSQALLSLQHRTTPQLSAGYLKVTLLDPHAANNHVPGTQVSAAPGLAGEFAKWLITMYQARANDPPVVVPANVDDTEVYYQHTQVSLDRANHGVYNLWGQVPVKGATQYADLSGPKVAHSGGGGVQVWYAFNVVPTLRDGANPFVNPTRLTAVSTGPGDYSGTSAPGASVLVFARSGDGRSNVSLGRAVADASGTWTVHASATPPSSYRVFARVEVPEGMPSPRAHLYHAVGVNRQA